MIQLERTAEAAGKVIYTAKPRSLAAATTGSRVAPAVTRRQAVAIRLATHGTNPEQRFAAGWSACFESAMALAACKRKLR